MKIIKNDYIADLSKANSTLQIELSESKKTIHEIKRKISAQASSQSGLHKAHEKLIQQHKNQAADLVKAKNELNDLNKKCANLSSRLLTYEGGESDAHECKSPLKKRKGRKQKKKKTNAQQVKSETNFAPITSEVENEMAKEVNLSL